MDETPPPAYAVIAPGNSVVDDNVPPQPPQYTFPASFNVGTRLDRRPFVDSAQVKGHLALLHLFALLRSQIDELNATVLLEDKDRRWAWFVSLAVER
jgi:hypothetical protein